MYGSAVIPRKDETKTPRKQLTGLWDCMGMLGKGFFEDNNSGMYDSELKIIADNAHLLDPQSPEFDVERVTNWLIQQGREMLWYQGTIAPQIRALAKEPELRKRAADIQRINERKLEEIAGRGKVAMPCCKRSQDLHIIRKAGKYVNACAFCGGDTVQLVEISLKYKGKTHRVIVT